MTKQQEIDIIKATIAKLTPDSYCGPALQSLLPYIGAQMADDFPVDLLATMRARETDLADLCRNIKTKTAELATLRDNYNTMAQHLVMLKREEADTEQRIEKLRWTARDAMQEIVSLAA
jgi:hypothetical protein